MRKLLRMSILTALLLIAALFNGCGTMQTAHAGETIPPPPIRILQAPVRVTIRPYRAWWSDATYRGMQRVSYQRYPIYQAPHAPVGSWSRTLTRGGLTHIIRYPVFVRSVVRTVQSVTRTANAAQPRARQVVWAPVTGYSWGCGTPNGITASGTVPSVGTIANDWLPFGARVTIPSLGYSGVVLDRGQGHGGFDLFMPSCTSTFSVTGYREVIIS